MDDTQLEPGKVVIYIDSSLCITKGAQSYDVSGLNACGAPKKADELILSVDLKSASGCPMGADEKPNKGKCMPHNTKKPPKPPRPPRGLLSLDAADEKLIREISEITKIKRARIERRKYALEKMKAAKASSSSTASAGNLMATLFTILFCAVIFFQVASEAHR